MPTYGDLKGVHPKYNAERWQELRALHAGGDRLLKDEDTMERLFHRHYGEEEAVYQERRRRAFYVPWAGEIVAQMTAAVFQRTMGLSLEEDAVDPDEDFYSDFRDDAGPEGGPKVPFGKVARDSLNEALVVGHAWVQVCLPRRPTELDGTPVVYPSLADEDAAGIRRAYLDVVPVEEVRNWKVDKSDRLQWLVHCRDEDVRSMLGPDDRRRRVYTVWTPYDWTEYAFEWDVEEFGEYPPDKLEPRTVLHDAHSFGAVPWVCLKLPVDLHAMDKLASPATEVLNKWNATSWAEYRNLFPILVVYQQGEDYGQPLTSDAQRATNQHIGPGRAMVMAEKDRVEFAQPGAGVYSHALDHVMKIRDEMHRVAAAMAMSADNHGALLRRSGESKAMDMQALAVVADALGALVMEAFGRVLDLVATGRADVAPGEESPYYVEGLSNYTAKDVDGMIEEAAALEAVSVPSPTFQRLRKRQLALAVLGDDVSKEEADAIEKELEENISAEQFLQPPPPAEPKPGQPADDEEEPPRGTFA